MTPSISTASTLARHITLAAVVSALLSVAAFAFGSAYAAPAASAATACTPTATLVNPCRPWLGAYAHGYPAVPSDLRSQVTNHEQRVGRKGDIVRGYYHVGDHHTGAEPSEKYLTRSEKFYVYRASTILLIDWKPATNWAAAGGGNPIVNGVIDSMADSIKSVAPHKIMMVLAHEPENDVSSGTSCPTKSTIGSGSPAEYRNMWANVRKRFAARGVTNVVWVMNYMAYKRWDCLVPQLWPGNSIVDWVLIDAYGNLDVTLDQSAGRFYRLLMSTSDATHSYLSKPWGLGEFSIHHVEQSQAYAYWDSVRAAVHNSTYPKLKAFVPFDSDEGNPDNRVAYGLNGACDPREQAHYNAFAHEPAFMGTGSTSTPPCPSGRSLATLEGES